MDINQGSRQYLPHSDEGEQLSQRIRRLPLCTQPHRSGGTSSSQRPACRRGRTRRIHHARYTAGRHCHQHDTRSQPGYLRSERPGEDGVSAAPGLTPPKLSLGTYISAVTTPRVLLCGGRSRDRGRPHTLVLLRRGGGCARAHTTEGPLPPVQAVPVRKANLAAGIVVGGT